MNTTHARQMRTLFLAIPFNKPRHESCVLMRSVNSVKICATPATFGMELPVALRQLIA